LRAQRQTIDETYLTDWARRLGIGDELSWLMDAAGA
jgi:hypothetical protein